MTIPFYVEDFVHRLVELARQYRSTDLGAAYFLAVRAHTVANGRYPLTEETFPVVGEVSDAIMQKFEQSTKGINIHLTERNHTGVLSEHSSHANRALLLLREYKRLWEEYVLSGKFLDIHDELRERALPDGAADYRERLYALYEEALHKDRVTLADSAFLAANGIRIFVDVYPEDEMAPALLVLEKELMVMGDVANDKPKGVPQE